MSPQHHILALLFVFLTGWNAHAQPADTLLRSDDVILEGMRLQEGEDHKGAIAQFDLVTRNDSNYYLALAEKAKSLMEMERYRQVIRLCKTGLNGNGDYDYRFYVALGNAYDELGRQEQAIAIYERGLKKYPFNQSLLYNLGLALYREKEYEQARRHLKRSVLCNNYHASSHLVLGLACADQGDVIPAMLSLETFLMLEPTTERAERVVGILSEIARGTHQPESPNDSAQSGHFREMAMIIDSKAALDRQYKVVTKLDDPLIRQTQVLCEKLTYRKGTGDFWMEHYVPTFKKLYAEDQLETFSYFLFASFNNAKVNNWLEKNRSRIKGFVNWYRQELLTSGQLRTIDGVGEIACRYYDNGLLRSLGDLVNPDNHEEGKKGVWTYFFYAGNPSSIEQWDDKGNRDGTWEVFYPNGTLKEKIAYKNNQLQGEDRYYFPTGELQMQAWFENDHFQGDFKRYYITGQVSEHLMYDSGKVEGKGQFYYPNGDLSAFYTFEEDQSEGPYESYHHNGQVSQKGSFKGGERHGPFTSYYESGKVESEGAYDEGKPIGEWKWYHKNGQLETEEDYGDDGKLTGFHRAYFKSGQVHKEFAYEDGQLHGEVKEYDRDGRLHFVYRYDHGDVQGLKCYDKSGAVVSEDEIEKGRLDQRFHGAEGWLHSTGSFVDNRRQGTWTFYTPKGHKERVIEMKDGMYNGSYESYFPSGRVRSTSRYDNDLENGNYRTYFANGQLKASDWFVNGKAQGYSHNYRPDGTLKSINYFVDGEVEGYQQYFHVDGKLDSEVLIANGMTSLHVDFDTLGEPVDSTVIEGGDGPVLTRFPTGALKTRGTLRNGKLVGDFWGFFPNGDTSFLGEYFNGERHGFYQSFHRNGQLESQGVFDRGRREGKWEWFYPNGKLELKGDYEADERVGFWSWFYKSGKVRYEGDYREGERHGIFSYYNHDGILCLRDHYIKDTWMSLSYPTGDNSFADPIDIPADSGKVIAYYPDGTKSAELRFHRGQRSGESVLYFDNGAVQLRQNYAYGHREGLSTEYYSSGKVKAEEPHLYNQLHGPCRYYRSDGTLEREAVYRLGERHGDWKYYDTGGNVSRVEKYRYDHLFE